MSYNEVPLKELLGGKGYIRGPFGSALKRNELKEDGIPVYEQQHAIRGDRVFRYFIDDEKYETLKRFTVETNDLIISCSGTVGRISVIREEDPKGIISQALLILRPNADKILPEYLFYFLNSQQGINELLNASQGAVQLNIAPRAVVEKIPVPLPSIDEQKLIVNRLKTVDDEIKLNSQTNQTLEQIAQAIFKSWFVDFEPTKAKIHAKQNAQDPERAAMRAISGKTDEQLDQLTPEQHQQLTTTAALFPDELEDSEIGEIPKGWERSTLSEICTFACERIDVEELTLENYISTENMLEGKKGVTGASSLPTVKTVPSFEVGQVLVSNIRPYFKKIWLSRFEGGRSNDVLGFKALVSDTVEFLYNLLYQDAFFNFMMATSKGAKMPRGDKDAIMGWEIPKPTLESRRAYSELVKDYYRIIESLDKENLYLTDIRDTLLPKLLSGEILLGDTQSATEAVAWALHQSKLTFGAAPAPKLRTWNLKRLRRNSIIKNFIDTVSL